jgi:hypothetical protein
MAFSLSRLAVDIVIRWHCLSIYLSVCLLLPLLLLRRTPSPAG